MNGVPSWIYMMIAIMSLIYNRNSIHKPEIWDDIINCIVMACILEIVAVHNMKMLCGLLLIPIIGVSSGKLFFHTLKQLP